VLVEIIRIHTIKPGVLVEIIRIHTIKPEGVSRDY